MDLPVGLAGEAETLQPHRMSLSILSRSRAKLRCVSDTSSTMYFVVAKKASNCGPYSVMFDARTSKFLLPQAVRV